MQLSGQLIIFQRIKFSKVLSVADQRGEPLEHRLPLPNIKKNATPGVCTRVVTFSTQRGCL